MFQQHLTHSHLIALTTQELSRSETPFWNLATDPHFRFWIQLDCGTAPPTNFKAIIARRHSICCEFAIFVRCPDPCDFARRDIQPYLGELQRPLVYGYGTSDCVAAYLMLTQCGSRANRTGEAQRGSENQGERRPPHFVTIPVRCPAQISNEGAS